ncbi:MAG: NADP-dependent phosphogluconate dehydrogenase [Rhodosalinus sp.]
MSEFGIIGLGRMGSALARRALDAGVAVAGTSRSGVPADLREAGLSAADGAEGLVTRLDRPRLVLLSLPAGPVVDKALDDLRPHLETGDVVLDGGNSYWGDGIRRSEDLAGDGIRFLDLGVSGGPDGARHAPCFMVGGPEDGVAVAEPVLRRLAGEGGGFVHAGGPGAGHFVKLVHNGIEFGMLQAIGEGLAMLKAHPRPLDIAGTLQAWRRGSVIRSWLVDLMAEAYAKDPDLACPSGLVEDTGEVNWLVGDAMISETPIPVIAQSLMELMKSRDRDAVAPRAITHMRHGFGGHPFGADESIAKERKTGRVGPLHRPDNHGR